MALFYRAQQWDDRALLAMARLRCQVRINLLFHLITKTGNGFFYVGVACLVGLFDPDRFANFMTAAVSAFSLGLTAHPLIKKGVRRLRPYETHSEVRVDFKPLDRFSFPSGHTTHAFLMASLLIAFYPSLMVPAFLWAVMVGLSRVFLGVHYPTDVLAGMVLGLVCGMLGLSTAAF